MKHKRIVILPLLALLLCLAPAVGSQAQEATRPGQKSIVEALESPTMGQGTIRIFQSPSIAQRMAERSGAFANARIEGNYAILQGYRIQMYSGNNSRSRGIATSRANQVRDAFPDLETNVEYDAPFWRLRVGAFVDTTEAREYLQVLQKEFPSFAREMYVVRATIKIPR